MTETVLREIVRRAVSDAAFRGELRSDPARALAGISLTAQERSALTSGDPTQLSALGVDQRMSKAFSAGIFSEASKVVIGDPDLLNSGTLTDEPTAGETRAIVGDPTSDATAATEASTWGQTHLRMIEQDLDTGATVDTTVEATGAVPSHLQMLEQDLDTGVTPTVDETPIVIDPGDATPTEF